MKTKKFLTLLLAAVFVLSCMTFSVYAEDASATSSTTAVKDVLQGKYDATGLVGYATYNVGELNTWNDYSVMPNTEHNYNRYANSRTNVVINDWNAFEDNWGGINPNAWDITVSPAQAISQRNYGGKNWGYMGVRYSPTWTAKYTKNSDGTYTAADEETLAETWDKVPDNKWGNVFDITDYMDNGYIVFDVDNITGDTKNAYFALASVRSNWCIPFRGGSVPGENSTLNKTDNDNILSSLPYAVGVFGVKLEDYYDIEKGGAQKVAIPLSEFTKQNSGGCGDENSVFSEIYFKNWSAESYYTGGVGVTFKPNFFSGAGIARQESGEGKEFRAEILNMTIVCPAVPSNLTAERNDSGAVVINWMATTDTDVSYQVVRTYKDKSDYFDVGTETSYTDTTGVTGRGYTYSVVAVDNTHGVKSKQSNFVTLASTGVKEIYEDFALEDIWETTKNDQKPEWESWPAPKGVGPYGSSIIYYSNDWAAHGVNGVLNATGRPRTYYINDMYYKGTQNASITYRTQDENGENYFAGETEQIWGFNGVVYRNVETVPTTTKDFALLQTSGYAIFDIKLEEGSPVDDAYLTISYVNAGLQPYMGPREQAFYCFIGVPLADYYDETKSGYQQIAVPLTDFNPDDEDVFCVILDTASRHNLDRSNLNMSAFHGMGILREDSRGQAVYDIDISGGIADALKDTAKPFAYTANRLMLVNVEEPADVQVEVSKDGITLNWEPSPTVDVTDYQVLKDGVVVATITDANTFTYTDTSAMPGFTYTYGVRAVSPTYEGVYSAADEVEAGIPNSAEIKMFAFADGVKYETKYAQDGKMAAEFYATQLGTGYFADYGSDGKLKSVAVAPVTAGSWSGVELTGCTKTDTVKAFLWDLNNQPLIPTVKTEIKTPKILAIGNSYSQNATSQLHQIAAADGVDMDVTNMYIGGCSLQTHWNNISSDMGAYEVFTNGQRVHSYGTQAKISEMLKSEEWDIVTIQQASWLSVNYSTFEPYVTNIVNYLNETEPNAEIIFHQTWEYSGEHGKTTFNDPNYKGEEMCASSLANARSASAIITAISGSERRIIPSGMAVRGVIETDPDYVIWSDGTHMSDNGCYLTGLVWYGTLLDGNIAESKYVPWTGASADEIAMFKQCAINAINTYSKVTD